MSCKICERMKEKEEVLYEDEVGVVLVGDAILGHITVHPKKHVTKIGELDDAELEHLFTIANLGSTVVFETLGAQGTNIVAHNGASQEHVSINVIPRNMTDDLNLHWEAKTLAEEEMKDALERIKDKADYLETKITTTTKVQKENAEHAAATDAAAPSETEETKGKKKKADEKAESETYLTRHLDRLP